MDDTIVISDEDDEQGGFQRLKTNGRLERSGLGSGGPWRQRQGSGSSDIIDLTGNSCAFENLSEDSNVIDLTDVEDNPLSPVCSRFHDTRIIIEQLIKSESQLNSSSLPKVRLSKLESGGETYWSSGDFRPCNGEVSECEEKSTEGSWTAQSDMRFPESVSNAMIKQEVFPCGSRSEMNMEGPSENSLTLQGLPPQATCTHNSSSPAIDNATVYPEVDSPSQPVASSTSTLITTKQDPEELDAQSPPLNKALLYRLRYFKKAPVNHLFFQTLKRDKNLHTMQIPLSRMNIVNNTKEENFHQGTLHFLSEFVSATYYPPKDIVSHVIHYILLGAEEQAIKHEAYMVLMRVQKLHPATLDTVAWDWKLLSEVMETKESQTYRLLLQYVVQTLDDDFQLSLQRRSLQKCLCKTMLSCDRSFSNVKDVIHWLIDAVANTSPVGFDNELDSASESDQQMVIFLLQRMLSIAVEVDNLPVMSSNRIADFIFPYIIIIKTRPQREMFLSSTDNILLRAKILEVIFHQSCNCPPPPDISLPLGKILYFIGNSTLLLENQGPEWQRWDEMLHHICLLFLSLQRIATDHLRIPVLDRTDEVLQRPHNQLSLSEEITEADVALYITIFQKRTSLGAEAPAALQDRLRMLQALLLTAVNRHTL